MERLNLYTSKRKRVKLITVVIFSLLMLIPGIVARVILDLDWKGRVKEISLSYSSVMKIAEYSLTGNERDIKVLNSAVKNYQLKADIMRAKQKKTIEFIKRAYVDKKLLKLILSSWVKDKEDWMVLRELNWDSKSLNLDFYEIYKPGIKSGGYELVCRLRAFGFVKEKVEFDVDFIDDLKLKKVVISADVGKTYK